MAVVHTPPPPLLSHQVQPRDLRKPPSAHQHPANAPGSTAAAATTSAAPTTSGKSRRNSVVLAAPLTEAPPSPKQQPPPANAPASTVTTTTTVTATTTKSRRNSVVTYAHLPEPPPSPHRQQQQHGPCLLYAGVARELGLVSEPASPASPASAGPSVEDVYGLFARVFEAGRVWASPRTTQLLQVLLAAQEPMPLLLLQQMGVLKDLKSLPGYQVGVDVCVGGGAGRAGVCVCVCVCRCGCVWVRFVCGGVCVVGLAARPAWLSGVCVCVYVRGGSVWGGPAP